MKKNKPQPEEQAENPDERSFPVVGIGASAGGLEALEHFFEKVPENSGMAYIVIQHLDPTQKGMLPELLQRISNIQVFQVKDGMTIHPNCIYVIPPNTNMSILKDQLFLFDPTEKRGLRLPINFFFRSLAEDRQEASIGVILSGMGSDGSLGLRTIKEKGGIVLVQEPDNAKFDGMPRSALDTLPADVVAPASELPGRLASLLHQTPTLKLETESKYLTGFEKVIILLRTQTGNDFSLYKKNTVHRRIERRMGVHKIEEIASYVQLLQNNPEEVHILCKELLIGVTSFFRDPAVWDVVREKIFPRIFANAPAGSTLRAWVAGCSTGEEAYSIAITFMEALQKSEPRPEGRFALQIFATDLDKTAIDTARKGLFPAGIASDVSPERLNRYFFKAGDHYQINNEIREMIVFAPHNVIMDPPFTNLDLLSCRNLLIYLKPELQHKLLGLFHYCLQPDGILILGKSESPGVRHHLFEAIEDRLKIFQPSATATPELTDFPTSFSRSKITDLKKNHPIRSTENIQNLAEQILLRHFSPAGVLVNENGDIIYISGRTGKYLEPAVGKANLNIFAMTREGLHRDFSAGFRKAIQKKGKVVLPHLKVKNNGGEQALEVLIQWLEEPIPLKGLLMVVFKDIPEPAGIERHPEKGVQVSDGRERERELEEEIKQLQEVLKSTMEEMQTSQEELKSANEELQSTNEELQSTNEELTTSKEEMQSMNEELQTVNAELNSKMNDYLKLNSEMNNLLKSTDIATLFLDKKLNIRNYTVQATEIFKLRPSDIGRPFTDQVSGLNYPNLADDAQQVLRSLVPIEKEIPTHIDRWFSVRIMPFRTFDDRIDGLVITFINITIQKQVEIKLIETEKILRLLLNSSADAVVGLTPEWRILEVNPAAEDFFGKKREEAINYNFFELFIPPEAQNRAKKDMENLMESNLPGVKFETRVKVGGESIRNVELSANPIFDENGKQKRVIIIVKNLPMP